MLDAFVDQASGLRRIFAASETRVLTLVADPLLRDEAVIQLAGALARQIRRVAVVDENNSVALQFGLRAKYELAHWLAGSATVEQVVLNAAERIVVLPAARGLAQLRAQTATPGWRIGELLAQAGHKLDLILCSAAVADARRPQVGFAGEGELVFVVGARADGITAAYGRLKLLVRSLDVRTARVLLARAKSEAAAKSSFDALAETARRFLGVHLDYCGYLPATDAARDGAAGHQLQRIGERLTDNPASAFALRDEMPFARRAAV